jgi:hypothetical protein
MRESQNRGTPDALSVRLQLKRLVSPLLSTPFDLALMQLRHEVNVGQAAFEISSNHLLRLRGQALVACLEHTLLKLISMPYKHGFSLELRLQHFVAAVEAVSPTVVAKRSQHHNFR